MKKLVEI